MGGTEGPPQTKGQMNKAIRRSDMYRGKKSSQRETQDACFISSEDSLGFAVSTSCNRESSNCCGVSLVLSDHYGDSEDGNTTGDVGEGLPASFLFLFLEALAGKRKA